MTELLKLVGPGSFAAGAKTSLFLGVFSGVLTALAFPLRTLSPKVDAMTLTDKTPWLLPDETP